MRLAQGRFLTYTADDLPAAGGGGGTATLEKDAEDAAKAAEAGSDGVKTIEMPEDELLAMKRDIDELKRLSGETTEELDRRRAENARLRDRNRQRRSSQPATDSQALTADTIAEALVKALQQTRPTAQTPTIPGLKFGDDGEVTYQGNPVDAATAELLVGAYQRGDSLGETLKTLQEQVKALQDDRTEQDSQREDARTSAIEQRHVARLEDYGLRICVQRYATSDEAIAKMTAPEKVAYEETIQNAREDFYLRLSRVLNGLLEQGYEPADFTQQTVVAISKPILERLDKRYGKVADAAQDAANKDARETATLKRGGAEVDLARPDLDKMTPEQRAVELDSVAAELAKKHGVSRAGLAKVGVSDRLDY